MVGGGGGGDDEGGGSGYIQYVTQTLTSSPTFIKLIVGDGGKFFKILDETIPPGHPLHKTFNRHTVKLSYSTMPNMLKKISLHNSKVTAKALAETPDVTLASEDNNNSDSEEIQPPEAHPCDECDNQCEGFIIKYSGKKYSV